MGQEDALGRAGQPDTGGDWHDGYTRSEQARESGISRGDPLQECVAGGADTSEQIWR